MFFFSCTDPPGVCRTMYFFGVSWKEIFAKVWFTYLIPAERSILFGVKAGGHVSSLFNFKKGTRKPHVAIICLDIDLNLISPLLFFHSPYLYKYPLASASPRKAIGSEPLRTDKRSSSWRESTVFNDTKVEVGWHSCTSLTAMADVFNWASGIKWTQHIYQKFAAKKQLHLSKEQDPYVQIFPWHPCECTSKTNKKDMRSSGTSEDMD